MQIREQVRYKPNLNNQYQNLIKYENGEKKQSLGLTSGIPLELLDSTKIQIQHLICYICKNILWKPITCNQAKCFANFCQVCLNGQQVCLNRQQVRLNVQQVHLNGQQVRLNGQQVRLNGQQVCLKDQQSNNNQMKQVQNIKCPKCKNRLQRTHLPLLKNLLSNIKLKCINNGEGCKQLLEYQQFLKHIDNCNFKYLNCSGCNQYFQQHQIQLHLKQCKFIEVTCKKCLVQMIQSQFLQKHTDWLCLEQQLNIKNSKFNKLQKQMQGLQQKLSNYEILMQKLLKGEALGLSIAFHTSFPVNFKIQQQQKVVTLKKASYNPIKQKLDFLHFYLTPTIRTSSLISLQWKISIVILKGNLLIGICSSLSSNSIDIVINKYGQIKKKEIDQNKYKLIRKMNFHFVQNDLIMFRYKANSKKLQIFNLSNNLQCQLNPEQTNSFEHQIYSFYSLDTLGDTLKFY